MASATNLSLVGASRMVGASRISDGNFVFIVVWAERMHFSRCGRTFCFCTRAVSLKTTDASAAVIGPSRPKCLAVAVSADEGRSEIAGRCFSCWSFDVWFVPEPEHDTERANIHNRRSDSACPIFVSFRRQGFWQSSGD